MNDADYALYCEVCGKELNGDKTRTIMECECGQRYAVTVTRIEA